MAEIFDTSVIESAADRYSALKQSLRLDLKDIKSFHKAAVLDELDEVPRYINRFIQLGRPDFAAEFLEKKSTGEVDESSALERIIAQNDLMSVAFFPRGMQTARTVCRIVIRDSSGRLRGHGTGFMISPSLMMTNNHVLASSTAATASTVEFDYAFGIDGNELPTKSFKLDPARFFETHDRKKLDFTIVAVEAINEVGDRLEERGWNNLISQSGKAVVDEPLNIIQHPAGEHMQIAIRENKVVKAEGDYFIYTTDTKRGSSGSPVLNDQWQIAALHHAGVPRKDRDGNWLRKDGGRFRRGLDDPSTIDWIANEGVRISRIIANMQARNLSESKKALFEEALERPAPMNMPPEIAAARTSQSPSGSSANSPTIGPDGIARWNFQLSFGPLGTPPVTLTRRAQAAGAAISAGSTSAEPTAAASMESVFEPRGDYHDRDADGQAVTAYYEDINAAFDGLSKADRYDALSKLVRDTHQTQLSYRSARHDHLYPWIDRHEDEKLKSIYSGGVMPEELFLAEILAFEAATEMIAAGRGVEATAIPDEELERINLELEATSAFNCEHVVPQSWFKGADEQRTQKSDLHHLFTCDGGCNSFRSNIPYWDFTPADEERIRAQEISLEEALEDPSLEGARASCGLRDGRRFEPDAGKGAVARATLYFVLRYPDVVGDVKTGSKKEFVKSNVDLLLKWCKAEPPSRYELHRNAEIEKIQGNRNPLIDRPQWLTKIDFGRGFS